MMAMAGFMSDNMAKDRTTQQGQVAEDIKNLMADKLIGETQTLPVDDTVAVKSDGVFKGCSQSQAVFL